MLKQSMTGADIAGEVTRIVIHQYGLHPDKCRGISGDSCAANLLAIDVLLNVFGKAVALPCLSHTFNNIGKQLKFEVLDTFLGKMHTLLSHSPYAKNLFLEFVGVTAPSTPSHRWSARFDRDLVLAMNWPRFLTFLAAYASKDEVKSRAARFMREELMRHDDGDPPRDVLIKLQLGTMVDVGKYVYSATYFLEGDMPLVRAVQVIDGHTKYVLSRCCSCYTFAPLVSEVDCSINAEIILCIRPRPCHSRSRFSGAQNVQHRRKIPHQAGASRRRFFHGGRPLAYHGCIPRAGGWPSGRHGKLLFIIDCRSIFLCTLSSRIWYYSHT